MARLKKYTVQVTRNSDTIVEVIASSKEAAKEKAIFEAQDHIGDDGEWSDDEFVATVDDVEQYYEDEEDEE